MKLEPLFKVENNKLFTIKDSSPVDLEKLQKICIKWSQIEMNDEEYNEEFLADLRDKLKNLDEINAFAILVAEADKPLETPEQYELFINAYNHAARRVKDCVSVAGISLPLQLLKSGLEADSQVQAFIDTLNIKHSQYVYFAAQEDINSLNLIENISQTSIVIY